VEKFMKDYYRTITEVERLCELLLQLLHEAISPPECSSAQFSFTEHTSAQPLALNARFQARGDFLEVAAPDIFTRHPFALLEAFLLMQQHPELKGIAAGTIRLICTNRRLIDKRFRSDPHCRSLFTSILRQPRGLTHALRRMNRYGILGAYLPVFGQIVGQMQYDLFHTYTVDEHTLYVVRNLRRFLLPEHEHEFALCSRIARRIAKPELLYLAALFHDIAKGRGGDHSTLGADDAADFCMQHGLSDHDTRLVAWLVRHHLEMSTTAQHKDIDDPEVITAFARNVIDQEHLDHLYLLTVADIRATNPRLWNNWKDTLLKGLYFTTREALSRGLDNPLALRDQLANTQQAARALLGDIDAAAVQALWDTLDEEAYFLRHSPDEIAWHTRQILAHDDAPLPLIAIREQTERGGTEIFLYAKDQGHLFALATSALDQLGLNILSARVVTTRDGHTLDTYIVLDEYGHALRHPVRIGEVSQVLAERLANDNPGALRVSRRPARQLRHFLIPTEVVFSNDVQRRHTVMELVTVDRPGLLARVGRAFVKSAVKLQHAKIATFGERAEDVFLITDRDNHPLDMRRLTALRNRLMETLDEP
jgi:[protein-PII] uridylyltransferase